MRRIWAKALCAILAAGALTACSDAFDSDDAYLVDPGTRQLVTGAEAALESYWASALPSFSQHPFEPPKGLVFYDDTHEPEVKGCRVDGPGDWVGNSFYCPGDQTLYLNPDLFAVLGKELDTPVLGGIVIHAHEFGHHLAELDRASFATATIGSELQADCYTGTFLSALQDGAVSIPGLGSFALYDAMQTIRRMGDEGVDWSDDVKWFEEDAHGGPAQRSYAMALGAITGDPSLCQAYELTGPIDTIRVGHYEFTPPPAARDIAFGQAHVMTSAAFPAMTLKVSPASTEAGDATTALKQALPGSFAGTEVTQVDPPNDFVSLNGLASASLRYQQDIRNGQPTHGVLVLATRGDGTGIILDVSAAGPSPDTQGWQPLGDAAFGSLWGVYFSS